MEALPLSHWENFYVIVGSAAGGLTGLTFVVIALIRDIANVRPAGVGAFVTPTIVHFGGVLALAAFLSMPDLTVEILSAAFVLGGLAGVVYGGIIAGNMRNYGTNYVPVREDWLWNVVFPTLAYAALLVVGILIWHHPVAALHSVAAVSLLLLFIGIRNAWDIAVWMTTHGPSSSKGAD
jgi:hypothetical protein